MLPVIPAVRTTAIYKRFNQKVRNPRKDCIRPGSKQDRTKSSAAIVRDHSSKHMWENMRTKYTFKALLTQNETVQRTKLSQNHSQNAMWNHMKRMHTSKALRIQCESETPMWRSVSVTGQIAEHVSEKQTLWAIYRNTNVEQSQYDPIKRRNLGGHLSGDVGEVVMSVIGQIAENISKIYVSTNNICRNTVVNTNVISATTFRSLRKSGKTIGKSVCGYGAIGARKPF